MDAHVHTDVNFRTSALEDRQAAYQNYTATEMCKSIHANMDTQKMM